MGSDDRYDEWRYEQLDELKKTPRVFDFLALFRNGGFVYYKLDTSVFFRFNDSIATSVETFFKAFLAENNISITYKQE